MARYFLISGATGLLGSYLMQDCLRRDLPVAVLVRKSRLESARGRVESILSRCETRMGEVLPRPVVLEGDICQPGLGLDESSRGWVERNCHSFVHSAASLSFEADEKTGEPWRSNFEGTRNVLDFVREVGIRQFHHVSTAYVCGLRTGTILESDVDVGQTLGNAYEESKLRAEEMVREASHLDRLTIHRPAIIVGDSRSGFTTTYHGFYTPLKVVNTLVGKIPGGEIDVSGLLQVLGLDGSERKNFVPVDWVSAVMTRVLADPSLHGQTYHLTPRTRVTIDEMATALESALQRLASPKPAASADPGFDDGALEEIFRTQMETYQSYWRDDPQFDDRNTRSAAPDLPCPQVDAEMMWRLARYAIENNFGWPVPAPQPAPLDVQSHLRSLVASGAGRNGHAADHEPFMMALEVTGPGGGQWTLEYRGQRLVGVDEGRRHDRLPVAYMNAHTFRRLFAAELTPHAAVRRGAMVVLSKQEPAEAVVQAVAWTVAAGLSPNPHLSAARAPILAG